MKAKFLNWGFSIAVTLTVVGLSLSEQPASVASAFQSQMATKSVQLIAEEIPFVTRMKLTPDERLLLITTLDGGVYVLQKSGRSYVKQMQPVYQIETGYDFLNGGEENGLTGLIVSKGFAANQQIFLLHAQKTSGVGKNRITRLTLTQDADGVWVGNGAKVIFEGNVNANGAHQIQGGENVVIDGVSHLLFSIGESYIPSYARQLSREAGKIMLIQETGEDPIGVRPYPAYPRIQAIGIRNVYDISVVPDTDAVYFTNNGPDANDTLIYAPILDGTKQFDFGWNGDAASMLQPTVNGEAEPALIIYHWETPVAPVDVVAVSEAQAIVNIFSSALKPAKEILRVTHSAETTKLEVLARAEPEDFGGNLLGLAQDSAGHLFFSDFIGTIYKF